MNARFAVAEGVRRFSQSRSSAEGDGESTFTVVISNRQKANIAGFHGLGSERCIGGRPEKKARLALKCFVEHSVFCGSDRGRRGWAAGGAGFEHHSEAG